MRHIYEEKKLQRGNGLALQEFCQKLSNESCNVWKELLIMFNTQKQAKQERTW